MSQGGGEGRERGVRVMEATETEGADTVTPAMMTWGGEEEEEEEGKS